MAQKPVETVVGTSLLPFENKAFLIVGKVRPAMKVFVACVSGQPIVEPAEDVPLILFLELAVDRFPIHLLLFRAHEKSDSSVRIGLNALDGNHGPRHEQNCDSPKNSLPIPQVPVNRVQYLYP